MTWHVHEELARDYVVGDLHGARAASVEAHVLACERCRSLVGDAVPPGRLTAIWAEVQHRVDAPRASWIERALMKVGLPDGEARLVASAPAFRTSWVTALLAALIFAVWASQAGPRGLGVFLVVAPIVPVLAVAGAYGPWVDPTHEVSVAAPYPALRLVLVRSVAVVLVSGAMALVASMFVPDVGAAAAWLLPSLALVCLTLLGARWLPLPVAAGVVAAAYALPLLGALYAQVDVGDLVESAAGQLVALAVGVLAIVLLITDPQLRAASRRIS